LRAGELGEVLPQFRSIELDIYAVHPSRRYVTAKVRLMIDFLVSAFRAPVRPP
jgi:DNA-binding transcriptional LysR family regulator